MKDKLLQRASRDDDGLKLVIKIYNQNIWKHAIFQIIGNLYSGPDHINRTKIVQCVDNNAA